MRLTVLGLIVSVLLCSCAALAGRDAVLPVQTIRIDTASGPKEFKVEVAADAVSQEHGLMYRRDLPADAGMLFDFHQEARVSFWMKNTPLPLDMLFIRASGVISLIHANAQPNDTTEILSGGPVAAVLEINGGRAAALGIAVGDQVRYPLFGP